MPRELKSKEEFSTMLEGASEVRVVRSGDSAKVKVRTHGGLFTLKTTSKEADALIKGIKVPVEEI